MIDASKRHFGDFNVIASDRRDGDPPQLIANAKRIQDTWGGPPNMMTWMGLLNLRLSLNLYLGFPI